MRMLPTRRDLPPIYKLGQGAEEITLSIEDWYTVFTEMMSLEGEANPIRCDPKSHTSPEALAQCPVCNGPRR